MAKTSKKEEGLSTVPTHINEYEVTLSHIIGILEQSRRLAARSVNAVMTTTYWEIGRRIVQLELEGRERADYGDQLLIKLAEDLSRRFGRGFRKSNLYQMRNFFLAWPESPIFQTASGKSEGIEKKQGIILSWSHYVKLLGVKSQTARDFYEAEAIRGGWTIRQLDRQISTQFYERTEASKNKAALLAKGPKPEDAVTPEEEIKDPYILEFLDLTDEYSESELEDALIRHLEKFLLELGDDFAFIGRQRRLRIGDEWYKVDLVFFHRTLRCLVLIDLKTGKFTHADAGQIHLYLNYASEQWVRAGENPPVGLILCTSKDDAVAHYALDGLPNKVLAAEYRTTLPQEKLIVEEIERTRRFLQTHSLEVNSEKQ